MKTLDKIILRDVLSHEQTEVDVAKGITVFTGSSDSGKSSVIRGLYQLFENKPAGIDLLRHQAKRGSCSEVVVEGTDDDGEPFRIERIRGKSRNEYTVNGETLKAFGLDTPQEVKKIANLSEHAFRMQSDGHFLLSATGGEVARVIGHTVGLHQIDTAFEKVRKHKSKNDEELRIAQSDLKRESDALDGYEGLDKAVSSANALEAAALEFDTLEERCSIAHGKQSLIASIPEYVVTVSAENSLSVLSGCLEAYKLAESRFTRCDELLRAVSCIQSVENTNGLEEVVRIFGVVFSDHKSLDESYLFACSKAAQLRWIPDVRAEMMRTRNRMLALEKADACVFEIEVSLSQVREFSSVLNNTHVIEEKVITDVDSLTSSFVTLTGDIELLNERKRECKRLMENLLSLKKTLADGDIAAHELSVEIDEYRRINPVCPECGAEQEHWK